MAQTLQPGRDAGRLETGLAGEWLLTNGIGGYASSTVLLCPTRRQHAWLAAPIPAGGRRHVFLGRFEESVHARGVHFPLSIGRYAPGKWWPHGHDYLDEFRLVPHPSYVYRVGDARITRELQMVRGAHVMLARYRLDDHEEDLELQLRPLAPFRDADALTHENPFIDTATSRIADGIAVRPYDGLPRLTIVARAPEAEFDADPVWYRGIEYTADLARGYDGHEDNYCPGVLRLRLVPGHDVYVAAAIGDAVPDPESLWHEQAEAARARAARAPGTGVRSALRRAADDFRYVDASGRHGIIAGWPWFAEWGRDTFISLPGLELPGGDLDAALAVLEGAVPFLRGGLMPNVFGATPAESSYNSVDAGLWFARAVDLAASSGAAPERIRGVLLPALVEMAEAYVAGTDMGIAVDEEGLLASGSPEANGTWMDARVDGEPVTPRNGCAVEVNALWYSLLDHLSEALAAEGRTVEAARWRALADRVGESFVRRFWLPDDDYLADRVVDGRPDRSLRPNAVIAAALPRTPLPLDARQTVVRTAEAELLTPRGLRTLAPESEGYIGRYAGSPGERDRAYHQGTVWAWLLGFYVEAHLRAFGGARRDELRALLDGFADHLGEAGLWHVSEVFDGDPPHRPGGTIAQAWNVGEMLRAYALLEEVAP